MTFMTVKRKRPTHTLKTIYSADIHVTNVDEYRTMNVLRSFLDQFNMTGLTFTYL